MNTQLPSTRSRKIRALLAGGLVLGLGGALTLAAWTDTVTVDGTFTAGDGATDLIEASLDNSTYTRSELSFTDVTGLQPGQTIYKDLYIRTMANQTRAVTLSNLRLEVGTGENQANIEYMIFAPVSGSGTCVTSGAQNPPSGAVGEKDNTYWTLAWSGDLSSRTDTVVPETGVTVDVAADHTATHLCYVIKTTGNLKVAKAATGTWIYTGTLQ